MAKAAVVETAAAAAPQHLQNKKKELITHCMSATKKKVVKKALRRRWFLFFTMGPQLKSTFFGTFVHFWYFLKLYFQMAKKLQNCALHCEIKKLVKIK